MIQFQENALKDGRTDKQKDADRQTLFHRTLLATTGGPIRPVIIKLSFIVISKKKG